MPHDLISYHCLHTLLYSKTREWDLMSTSCPASVQIKLCLPGRWMCHLCLHHYPHSPSHRVVVLGIQVNNIREPWCRQRIFLLRTNKPQHCRIIQAIIAGSICQVASWWIVLCTVYRPMHFYDHAYVSVIHVWINITNWFIRKNVRGKRGKL